MPASLDHLDPLSTRELIARGLVIGNTPEQTAIERLLEVRAWESEAEASRELVEVTQKLVDATQRLGSVTWWLVAGTLLMGLAAGIDVLPRLTRGAH